MSNTTTTDEQSLASHDLINESTEFHTCEKGTPKTTDSFNQVYENNRLPNELIKSILEHLTNEPATLYQCTITSKLFYSISNPLLWKVFDFNSTICPHWILFDIVNSHLLVLPSPRISTLAHHIRDLRLNGLLWTDELLLCLIRYIPCLEKITIDNSTSITDISLQQLLYFCRQLHSINIQVDQFSQLSFDTMGQYCHQLCDVTLNSMGDLSPKILETLISCPVQRLHIRFYNEVCSEETMIIMKSFQHLTDLTFFHHDHGFMTTTLPSTKLLLQSTTETATIGSTITNTDSHLLDNDDIIHWPQLTTFTLKPCQDLDDATLIHFIKYHPQLQELQLYQAEQLTDMILDAMGTHLPHLKKLHVTGSDTITSDGVRRFIQGCPHLEYVTFFFCENLDTNDFDELSDAPLWYGGCVFDQQALDDFWKNKLDQIQQQ